MPKSGKTTPQKVDEFETLYPLLEAMFQEFKELSKKKPDGQVGTAKIKIVNRLLVAIHKILEGEPNCSFLDFLVEDDLPKNSDVVLILSQTDAAMKAFKSTYWSWDGFEDIWRV